MATTTTIAELIRADDENNLTDYIERYGDIVMGDGYTLEEDDADGHVYARTYQEIDGSTTTFAEVTLTLPLGAFENIKDEKGVIIGVKINKSFMF